MSDRLLCNWKPARGTHVLEQEAADARALLHERTVKAAVRRRDARCRWPVVHRCRFGLEVAHIVDRSLMGDTSTENLLLICAWIHRRGPQSIHGKQLRIEADTDQGANGPLSFWQQDEAGVYYCVARETAPFQVEHD